MRVSISDEAKGKLTTLQMIQRPGSASEIDLVTSGSEVEVVEELIGALAAMRCRYSPAVSRRLHANVPLRVVTRASFATGQSPDGHLLLAVRDPGLGWIALVIDEAARTFLLDALGSS